MTDSFGRKLDYLRLSVTDRCNFRCVYCLPAHGSGFVPAGELLSDEEIVRVLACFAELGISKVRITGGEPLLRPRLAELVSRLAQVAGIRDLSLSTNGVLLKSRAQELARAGLTRVNVSVDTLDPDKFRRVTRFGNLNAVLEGVQAALKAKLEPVKINVVVARGMNDGEVEAFARLTETLPVHVRFIELMPMGDAGFFSMDKFVSLAEMQEKAAPLQALPAPEWPRGFGPARYFRRPGALGTVGFIAAMSCSFCHLCNRMRLSSKGVLYPCLDSSEGTDLRALLRGGADGDAVREAISSAVARKPERHQMEERARGFQGNSRVMCQVGG